MFGRLDIQMIFNGISLVGLNNIWSFVVHVDDSLVGVHFNNIDSEQGKDRPNKQQRIISDHSETFSIDLAENRCQEPRSNKYHHSLINNKHSKHSCLSDHKIGNLNSY